MNSHVISSAVMMLAQQKLKRYRVTNTDQVEAFCPFPHNHPKVRRSFYISLNTGLWICHSCGRRGSLHRLYLAMGLALDTELESMFKQMRTEDITTIISRSKPGTDILPMEIAFLFASQGPKILLKAGFTKSTLISHMIGIDPNAERFTVPIWSRDGKLRAISGRALDPNEQPKYLIYRSEDLRHISGEHILSEYSPRPHNYLWREEKVPKKSEVIIVEGFKAAMWVAQLGYHSLALMNTDITRNQIDSLVSLNPLKITLALDNDGAGIVGTPRVARKVLGIAPVRIFSYPQLNAGQSPDDLPKTEIQRGLAKAETLLKWRTHDEVRKSIQIHETVQTVMETKA